MSIKLCAQSDVEDIWSEEGVEGRFDDGMHGALDATDEARILRFIERASADVSSYLKKRYSLADFAGTSPPTNTPAQVKYWTAVVAAYYSGTRRGLSVPKTLEDQYKWVFETLQKIIDGELDLADVNDSFEHLPCVSNFVIDGRYKNAKVRKIISTSTGARPVGPIKENIEANPPSYPFD